MNTKKQKTPVKKKFRKDCGRCGYQHDHGKCPAQGKKCSKCHKLNHFGSCCLSKNPDKKGVNCVDECSDDELFIGFITSVNSVDASEWHENLTMIKKIAFFFFGFRNFVYKTCKTCEILGLNFEKKTVCLNYNFPIQWSAIITPERIQ